MSLVASKYNISVKEPGDSSKSAGCMFEKFGGIKVTCGLKIYHHRNYVDGSVKITSNGTGTSANSKT